MQAFDQSLKFRTWQKELDKNGITIHGVTELHSVRKKNGEVLFSLLNVKAQDQAGTPLLPVVMLRGHFVSVVTWLRNRESGERKLLLVAQRRVANGAMFLEHPAGMMDEDGDPWAVAVKEVKEETGVSIQRNQLSLLWPEVLYSSPGLIDEGGWFFQCELEMSGTEIDALDGGSGGEGGEGEFIQTQVMTPEEAMKKMANTQALLGLMLAVQIKS